MHINVCAKVSCNFLYLCSFAYIHLPIIPDTMYIYIEYFRTYLKHVDLEPSSNKPVPRSIWGKTWKPVFIIFTTSMHRIYARKHIGRQTINKCEECLWMQKINYTCMQCRWRSTRRAVRGGAVARASCCLAHRLSAAAKWRRHLYCQRAILSRRHRSKPTPMNNELKHLQTARHPRRSIII